MENKEIENLEKNISGPLEVLLDLISEKKLEIGDIAISEVTEKYLQYIDKLEDDVDPVTLSDFLVVATKLLLMKSRSLLPQFGDVEEEDGEDLESQLKLYKAFVEASKTLQLTWGERVGFFRYEPAIKAEGFVSPQNVTIDVIYDKMIRLVQKLTPPKSLPKTNIDAIVSLKHKINNLRNLLKRKARFSFSELIEDKTNKTDIIVSFLALLELAKQQSIAVSQKQRFGEIVIKRSE